MGDFIFSHCHSEEGGKGIALSYGLGIPSPCPSVVLISDINVRAPKSLYMPRSQLEQQV